VKLLAQSVAGAVAAAFAILVVCCVLGVVWPPTATSAERTELEREQQKLITEQRALINEGAQALREAKSVIETQDENLEILRHTIEVLEQTREASDVRSGRLFSMLRRCHETVEELKP